MIAVLGSLFSPARVRRASFILVVYPPSRVPAGRAIHALTPPIQGCAKVQVQVELCELHGGLLVQTARSDSVIWYTLSFGLSWLELGHASVDG